MLDTLIERQRITARHWFDRVAPLDAFTAEAAPTGTARVCFTDLTLAYQLRTTATHYLADAYDRAGRSFGAPRTLAAGPGGRACLDGLSLAPTVDAYTILRLRLQRDSHELPPVELHLARDAAGRPQIIGLRRR
jgi:hypothetical protein